MKDRYTFKNKTNLIQDIKKLQDYEGYIQFSDTKIRDCDIFLKHDIIASKLQPTSGFIYEAHFWNGRDSIAIRQINSDWYVDETKNTPLTDTKTYFGINSLKVKMAQIWEEEPDELCEGMKVKKLKKVVFAGFDND